MNKLNNIIYICFYLQILNILTMNIVNELNKQKNKYLLNFKLLNNFIEIS